MFNDGGEPEKAPLPFDVDCLVNDKLDNRSIILDLALDILAEATNVEKSAILLYLEGRSRIAPSVEEELVKLAEKRGCFGVAFEVIDTPQLGYHALLRLIAELNVNLSSFLRWFTLAGVKINKQTNTYQLINPFGEPIAPPLTSVTGVKSFIRSFVTR